MQQNDQASLPLSTGRHNNSLGYHKVPPNSLQTKNQRNEHDKKSKIMFAIGISDKKDLKKKGKRGKGKNQTSLSRIHEPPKVKNTAKFSDSNLFVSQGKKH